MKALLASLALSEIALETGQVFSHHEVTLFKDNVAGDPVQTVDDSITFEDLDPGVYFATAVSLDGNGQPLAPLQTSTLIVVAVDPATTAKVVTSITLSLVQPAAAGT